MQQGRAAIVFAIFVFISFSSLAQKEAYRVYGRVLDGNDDPVPGAFIVVNDTLRGSSSDQGIFEIFLKNSGRYEIQIRHSGFEVFEKNISLNDRKPELEIIAKLAFRELKTVEIVEQAKGENLQKIDAKSVGRVPSASGDFIQQALGAQAGVAMNNELTASYSVRGGSYDENLVYVNGVQVYRPFLVRAGQQEGLSFLNSALVDNIKFSAGGFSARYGDKMSSVLDIQYKKPQTLEGEFALGLMGGDFAFGNSSKNQKWTYIGGVRFRSNQLLLGSLETKGEYQPQFWDAQVYATHKISEKSEIGILGVYSNNRFRFVPQTRVTEFGGFSQALRFTVFFDGKEESKQQSATGAIDFTHYFSNQLKLKVTASHFATYQQEYFDIIGQYRLDETNRDFESDDFGDVVRNLGIGGFLNHARNYIIGNVSNLQAQVNYEKGKHFFRLGAQASVEQFEEQWREYQYVDSADYSLPRNDDSLLVFENIRANNQLNTFRYQFFAEDEITWKYDNKATLSLNAGLRAHYYQFNDQWVGGPRVSVSYSPVFRKQLNDSTTFNRRVTFRASTGLYYQPPFYRDLRGLNGEISSSVMAQKSTHAVIGMEYNLFIWKRPFKLISEAYYKWYDDLIPYELENVRIRYYGTNNAVGFARGFDVKLHGEFIEGLESWISAGILDTQEDLLDDVRQTFINTDGDTIQTFTFNRQVDTVLTDAPGFIPRPTDQRFRVGLFFKDEMPGFEDLTVQLSIQYGTPLPFGPPDFNRYKDVLRTTSYKRVDVGFSKEFIKPGKNYTSFLRHLNSLNLTVEFLNLLDAQNVVNSTWIKDVSGGLYGIPNYLTRRLINIKVSGRF
ncbi:MAG: TonB-dependent receptor [Luteibaculum sp.]